MPVSVFFRLVSATTLLWAFTVPGEATAKQNGPQLPAEAQAAAKALDDFHDALGRGDRNGALSLLSEDALIYESGHAERKSEYAAHHLAADIAYAKAVPATITSRAGHSTGSLVWVTTEGRTVGAYKGKAVDRRTVETAILRLRSGKWRILHLHWSSAAR
jgi:ketosteroid isomerase-like protein